MNISTMWHQILSRKSRLFCIKNSIIDCVVMMMHSLIVLEFAVIPRPIEPDLVVGCSSDDECPDYNSCRNKQCIDPCILDDPCAINAFCKVVGHEPECKCPEGFFGDPRVECKPRKRQEKICSFESFVDRFFASMIRPISEITELSLTHPLIVVFIYFCPVL